MKVPSAFGLCGLLIVVLVTASSANAFATTRAHHAVFSCPPTQTVGTGFGFDPGAINGDEQWYAAGARSALVQCPVNFATGTAVTITGWSNSAGDIEASLCYSAASGGAPFCGTPKVSTTGLQTYAVPIPTGGIPAGAYVYLDVVLVSGSSSTFWGYTDNGP